VEDDSELGSDSAADPTYTVTINIAAGGAMNATQVVNKMKTDLSNPTTPLAMGKLMTKFDKSKGLRVKSILPKSTCSDTAKKWSYMDAPADNGPANWKKTYPKCGLPGVQSPVRLPMATPKKAKIVMRRLDFDYKPGKVNLINDGRSLMSMIPPGSTFRVSGKADSECTLQYAVFHSPSEHVFTDANGNDIRYAAELQLHHRAKDGRLVVVAVLFKVNAFSPFLSKLFKKIPDKCASHKTEAELKFEDIMPFNREYYMYYGSITSPPCTDTVTWYVLRHQSTVSLEQIEQLRKKLNLDVVKPPAKASKKSRGTTLGGHTVAVIDEDKFPKYTFSKTLLGNVRPVQPLGTRSLWSTPSTTPSEESSD